MSIAIYFKQEAFAATGSKVMGRNVAGESFLRALLDAAGGGDIWALIDDQADAAGFRAELGRWGSKATPRLVPKAQMTALGEPGLLFLGGPGLGEHAWERAPFGSRSWSLCGITHTTASHRAMDGIVALLTSPVERWDALICTSRAVKANIMTLLERQAQYLTSRLGAQRLPLPQLPVIPLGVHAADFARSDDTRERARADLGFDADTVVVLFVGRLSFHGKAHPIAMYTALERAAVDAPGKRVVLVEYGRFANIAIEQAFAEGARISSPALERIVLDGRDAEAGRRAWAAADIFCSLSDNVQEAFGITPVEAMAAGLPVVVSDWDGYKDTVRHGVDGFRIPTVLPRIGAGEDIAIEHQISGSSLDRYLGYVSAATAVDFGATVEAFRQLICSPDLRRRMGGSGRRRVLERFDWSQVFKVYRDLETELGKIRQAASDTPKLMPPARLDPFESFAGYPTVTLDEDAELALARDTAADALLIAEQQRALVWFGFATPSLPDPAEFERMVALLGAGPQRAGTLWSVLAPHRRRAAVRGTGWLLKIGALRMLNLPPVAND